jgi:septal ring factor EnvC (AmiA/AmiB activator)
METADNAWHLNKSVPVSLIMAMFLQSAAAIWWASSIESRVGSIAKSDDAQAQQIRTVETSVQSQAVEAATLTAQLPALNDALDEVRTSQHETNDLLRQLTEGGVKK